MSAGPGDHHHGGSFRTARGPGQRRVADVQRRPRRHEVLASGADRRGQLRQPRSGVALAFRGRGAQPRRAGRRRVADRFPARLRRAAPARPAPLARRPAAHDHQPQGDPADGRRPVVHQHAHLGRGRGRRADRRDDLDLQPEELRGRHHHHERPLEPARRGVLVGRAGAAGRTHLLGHRQRLPGLRRCRHRPALRRLRRGRARRLDEGHPARDARRAGLAERPALLRPVAADRRRRHGGDADVDLVAQQHEGAAARLDARLRRAHGGDRMDVPYHPPGRRVRQRHVGRRLVAPHRQGRRVDDDERRPAARLHLPAPQHGGARLLRRPPARRQPVRGEPAGARPGNGRTGLALPVRPPRAVGLRPAGGAQPGRRRHRRPAGQGGGADHQAGLRLRVRPRDGRAAVADRGTAGRHRDRPRRRSPVADPAVSDASGAVRVPGRDAGRPGRLHPRDPGAGDRRRGAVPHRPALHTAEPARHRIPAEHRRRRELGRGRVRPRDRDALRPVPQRVRREAVPRPRAGRGERRCATSRCAARAARGRRCRGACRCSSRRIHG